MVRSVAFSPDGRSVLTGSFDKTARLWEMDTGRELQQFVGHTNRLASVAFSPNGRTVLTGGQDGSARLWEVATGRELRQFLGHSVGTSVYDVLGRFALVSSVAFSPDGQTIATGGNDTTARLWEVATGRELRRFTGHSDWIQSVAFSPDGRTVLTGSMDHTSRLWEVATGNQIRQIMHAAWVESAVFSPDGQTVLSGIGDGTTDVWNIAADRQRATMIGYDDNTWLTITPEGFFDASSPKAAQNLSIVRGLEVSSVDQVYNALYRPDLVREKLAGDPDGKVKAAAAKLDLNKVMASGAAPKVAITAPAAGSSSPADEVAVEATVSDQGGGIGKVEWRVNGVTSGIETRGLERVEAAASAGRSLTVKRSLALERGENRIEVLAYNAKDLIASEAASVTVSWDGEKTATPPKLFVMAVGVNDYYDSRLRLSYAVPDATAIAEGFRKAGTGLYAAVDVTTVLDTDVTIANLDKVFTELGKKAQPRDVFVFFLAGHGKTKNGRYYFLPRDFRYEDEDSIEKTGMDQDKFQAWFAKIPARKSILLYDTCESGSLTGTKARGSDIDERLGALNRMTRATGRTFLTATTDDAPALEGYRGHGVFTYALLDALEHADVNKNGLIEVSELADYIDQKVPDFSFEAFKLRQIPQRNIVGNNFALTNKTSILTTANDANSGNRQKGNGPVAAIVSALSGTAIPTKPTHVLVAPSDVLVIAAIDGVIVERLAAGSQVTLVELANGWAAVARNGKKIGYVQEQALLKLQ
ncbi:putative caspase-like protein [Bradyrhizobium sp. AZCC 2289]